MRRGEEVEMDFGMEGIEDRREGVGRGSEFSL